MAPPEVQGAEQHLITAIANDEVEEMLRIQANITPSVTKSIGSSLHVATMYSSVACVRRLLEDAADVNLRNKDGYSPVHLAASDGDVEILRLLIVARADLHLTTFDARARLMGGALALDAPGGRNALHLAAEKARLAAVELLFAECPTLADAVDFDGALPREVTLREGSHAATLAPSRRAIAELLDPSECIPDVALLRKLADQDLKKQRQRLDTQEAIAKAAKKAAASLPADFGYEAKWPELYSMQVRDIKPLLSRELCAALSLSVDQRARALRNICEEITPGVYAFQMVPEGLVSGLHQRLLEEIDSVEDWAGQQSAWVLRRPNSMNRTLGWTHRGGTLKVEPANVVHWVTRLNFGACPKPTE